VYSQRNNNSSLPGQIISALVALVFFIVVLSRMFSSNNRPNFQPGPGPRPPTYARVVNNPIEEALAAPAGITKTDGAAAAILVDVSGSMREKIRDADGQAKPKIDIAKRCVINLVTQAEKFSKEHPERPILLGIYEFSGRANASPCRNVVPLSKPDLAAAAPKINRMQPDAGTPIGDAIIAAKLELDRAGRTRTHILVVTDGENTQGYLPQDVISAISRLDVESRPAVYFIAFDIAASRFNAVRDAGALVLGAANETELNQTLDYLLTGKILAEQPPTPGK
jgi:hypothetical protein